MNSGVRAILARRLESVILAFMIRLGSLLLLSLAAYIALALGPHMGIHIIRFFGFYVCLSILCILAWRSLKRGGTTKHWGLIWLGAVLFRVVGVFGTPELSDDIYRYIWDGRMSLEGINPFRHAPEAPEVAVYRNALWELINNRSLPTIYPPLLQMVFAFAARVAPTVLSFKALITLFDLGAGVFLFLALRRSARENLAVLYLWHPTVIIEFSGQGHSDAVGLFLVCAALWSFTRNQTVWSGLALSAAAQVKFFPLLVLPMFLRTLKVRWVALPALFLAFYIPFSLHGVNPLGSLSTFASEWRANAFVFKLLEALPFAPPRYWAGGILVVVVILSWVRNWAWPLGYSWILGTALLVSPVVHTWYVLWLLPVALFVRHSAWVVWTFTVPLAYWVLPRYLSTGAWIENGWIRAAEYIPVLVLVVFQCAKRRLDRL